MLVLRLDKNCNKLLVVSYPSGSLDLLKRRLNRVKVFEVGVQFLLLVSKLVGPGVLQQHHDLCWV
jgi:hypothetical protein